MSKIQGHIEALQLFNEKANKLSSLSFIEELAAPDAGITIAGEKQGNGTWEVSGELRGPSQEAVDAFVLTFRFFIQDNERSSLHNIAAVYDSVPVDAVLKQRFASARDAINRLLDSPNIGNVECNGARPTNREIMLVFVYGGLAHANLDKQRRFQEWMSFPPAAVVFKNTFTLILGNLLHAIMYIAKVNREAIQQLEAASRS